MTRIEARDEILRAYDEPQVIYLPDRDILHESHLAFSALFGEIGSVPQLHSVEGHPAMQIIRRAAPRRAAADTGRVADEGCTPTAPSSTSHLLPS